MIEVCLARLATVSMNELEIKLTAVAKRLKRYTVHKKVFCMDPRTEVNACKLNKRGKVMAQGGRSETRSRSRSNI